MGIRFMMARPIAESQRNQAFILAHVWVARGVCAFKKFFAASGSIFGARSVITGGKTFFSNTINGDHLCRQIKANVF